MLRLTLCGFMLMGLSLVSVGCAPSRTETFNITVKNDTAGPITLSLAKDPRQPYEPVWATPEDLAIETPKNHEAWANARTGMGQVVAAGQTATVNQLKGQFTGAGVGYLRAYAGDFSKSISQMLARSAGSPDRVDVPLTPGDNHITIKRDGARLVGE